MNHAAQMGMSRGAVDIDDGAFFLRAPATSAGETT